MTYAGTAGVMFDLADALGDSALASSFSRIVFSFEIMRRDAILGRRPWHRRGSTNYDLGDQFLTIVVRIEWTKRSAIRGVDDVGFFL